MDPIEITGVRTAKSQHVSRLLTTTHFGVSMASLKLAHALLTPETQKALSLPVAALILGAVSQAETVIEIVDRVCGQRFRKVASSPVPSGDQELQTLMPR